MKKKIKNFNTVVSDEIVVEGIVLKEDINEKTKEIKYLGKPVGRLKSMNSSGYPDKVIATFTIDDRNAFADIVNAMRLNNSRISVSFCG